MSTKIYNGYRLDHMNLLELLNFSKRVQKLFLGARDRELKKLYGEKYNTLQPKLQERAWDVERGRQRDPLADFSAEVAFLPIKNAILAITYWEHKTYDRVWKKQPEVKYYGYWNNVDQDEDCTEAEWEQRKQDWDLALPGSGIPAQNGFSFRFVGYNLPILKFKTKKPKDLDTVSRSLSR